MSRIPFSLPEEFTHATAEFIFRVIADDDFPRLHLDLIPGTETSRKYYGMREAIMDVFSTPGNSTLSYQEASDAVQLLMYASYLKGYRQPQGSHPVMNANYDLSVGLAICRELSDELQAGGWRMFCDSHAFFPDEGFQFLDVRGIQSKRLTLNEIKKISAFLRTDTFKKGLGLLPSSYHSPLYDRVEWSISYMTSANRHGNIGGLYGYGNHMADVFMNYMSYRKHSDPYKDGYFTHNEYEVPLRMMTWMYFELKSGKFKPASHFCKY